MAITIFCTCCDRSVDVAEAAPQRCPLCSSPVAGRDGDPDFGTGEGLVDVTATENYLG